MKDTPKPTPSIIDDAINSLSEELFSEYLLSGLCFRDWFIKKAKELTPTRPRRKSRPVNNVGN